jgi:hypothetical protein
MHAWRAVFCLLFCHRFDIGEAGCRQAGSGFLMVESGAVWSEPRIGIPEFFVTILAVNTVYSCRR